MARGKKKNLTLDEQLENIIAQIEDTEVTLKELKKQKKELEVQIKEARLVELDELITASGKTIDDVKEFLES